MQQQLLQQTFIGVSHDLRNVVGSLAKGWYRQTGRNGCLSVVGVWSSLPHGIIAVMVSSVLSILVCTWCVIPLQAVWADYCSSYKDTDGFYHDDLQCGSQYCCGDWNKKYCCSEEENRLPQVYEEGRHERLSRAFVIAPIVVGVVAIITVTVCVALIICCVCPCCPLHKKCCERRNQRQQTVITTTVFNAPQLPLSPTGYQPSQPGYLPVPVMHGYGGPPTPTAPPPSYQEAIPFPQGQPMYPFPPPGQNYLPPPHSDELEQLPYNPSYVPNP
ncbi:protein shisa-5-like isoform X2 [Trachinotus anak]|uniref:protein shisa-5-like isoform X2 n=1 Tax=Trachinotus anak TaxID=443729 RepID=UPI0039F1CFB1